MPRTVDYLKILADKEVGNFVVIHFDECFRSTREALYSKLGEEKNRKAAESFYTFLNNIW